MLGAGDKVGLFGRFRIAPRDQIARRLADLGASAVKDMTRATTLFVVGSGAQNLLSNNRLVRRLGEARTRSLPVIGEARLLDLLDGKAQIASTLPIESVAAIPDSLADVLNAFDLIHLRDRHVAFGDSDTLKNAARLYDQGMETFQVLAALRRRRTAPRGRHQLSADAHGEPVLQWEDGVTNLAGQGMLPLDDSDTLDGLFEEGLEAEMDGDLEAAARVYETCALADKRDPIAPFNLGNVLSAQGRTVEARFAYERAISRDPKFAEAHFNLGGLLERDNLFADAVRHLTKAIEIDPAYPEPLYNLAQIALRAEDLSKAEDLYRRFLQLADDGGLKTKAEKALKLIALHKSA